MTYNTRLGVAFDTEWQDGELWDGATVSLITSLIKAAVNANYEDIQKLEDGSILIGAAAFDDIVATSLGLQIAEVAQKRVKWATSDIKQIRITAGDNLQFSADGVTWTNLDMDSKMNVDGSNSNVADIGFNTAATSTPSFGHIAYNANERTFQAGLPNGVVGDFFSETFYPVGCKNVDSVQINDGDFVMYFGAEGNSGVSTIKRASTSLPLAGAGMGIATENIAVNAIGKITWFGYVRGIQTNGANYGETWVDGQMLYNSGTVAGGLSKTKPVAPKNAVFVGIVVRAHASNGILLVRPMFFPQLVQLSDVYSNAIANGDGFLWNSANARFENIAMYTKAQLDSLFTANSLADKARANHTGTQSADTVVDGTTNKVFTATEKTKLAGISTGAQVNNISDVNATDLTDGGETVLHIHDGRYYTETELNAGALDSRYFTETEVLANYYNKTDIDNKISSMYKFKGTVANYAALPASGNVAGDVWNLADTGQNYAWTGTAWDDIGGTEQLATAVANGLMSKEDFSKLATVQSGAEVNQNAFSAVRVTDGVVVDTISAGSKTATLDLVAGLNVAIEKTVDGKIEISTSGDISIEAANVAFTPYGNLTGLSAQTALENVSDFLDTTLSVTAEELGAYTANWDADTLNGHPSADFALAAHNHTGIYAPLSHAHATSDVTGLDAQIDKIYSETWSIYTIPASAWTGASAPFTAVLDMSGYPGRITASSNQEMIPYAGVTAVELAALQKANIIGSAQAADSITLKAFGTKPAIDLRVTWIMRGVK